MQRLGKDFTGTSNMTPIELTPAQKQQWGDTMSLMAWSCPGFRHIFYKLLANNDGNYVAIPTMDIPTACTDGKNIMINPEFFFGLGLKERVFVTAHEIVHNVYDDVGLLHRMATAGLVHLNDGTTLPFDNAIMQKAMDFRINALLVESHIGELPKGGCYDLKVATAHDSVIDIYKKLYEDDKGKGKRNGPGNYRGGNPFDQLLPPGTSTGQNPAQAASQRNPQQWAVEIASAQTLETMRTQGKMPGALQRMFKDILEPKVPWTDHILSIMNRRVGSGSYNWKRPDRRFIMRDIHMPSRSGHGAGWLVVWGDTSGSIGKEELCGYMAELSSIIEDVRPRRLTILWCDAKIHRIDELEDAGDMHRLKYAAATKGVGGGGGTSVHPVMKWIDKHTEMPDMFIGFTDGYVTFPDKEPTFPVIWASTTEHDYPWGEVVSIK